MLCCWGMSSAGLVRSSAVFKGELGEPISNVSVYAFALTAVPGETYVDTFTDTNGAFHLQLPDATWFVQVDSAALNALGYRGVPARFIYMMGADRRVDFICQKPC